MNLKSVLILAFIMGISALNKDKDCSCRLNAQKKVLNGKIISHNAYPWVVKVRIQVQETFGYIGTATILNNDTLLTSGLVPIFWPNDEYYENPDLYNKPIFEIYTRTIVTVAIKRDGKDEEVRRIAKIIPHPKYRYTGLDNQNITLEENVALLKLHWPLKFDDSIRPACLDASEQTYTGPLTVVGYGAPNMKRWNLTDPNAVIREGSLVDSSNEDCDQREGKIMCVKGRKNAQNLCFGDSGAAIHQTKNGKTSIIAIESHDKYFEGPGQIKCEGSYASRLSHYMSWIKEHIGNRYCE